MIMKTLFRTVLSHLWNEIYPNIAHLFCRKLAETNLTKFLSANLNSLFNHKEAKNKNDNEGHLPHGSISSVTRDIHKNLVFFSAQN